jgi:glycosyltransferase involved in cell wall biosynthesis
MQVDVVTAVHAPYAAYLPALWESLRGQTHRDWSWLVQIDGPSEAVRKTLDACGAAADRRVHVAGNGTGEGPAVTRNVALGRGRAPLVQNADADDVLERQALEALSAGLAAHPSAGFAVGHARDLRRDGRLVSHELPVPPGLLERGTLLRTWRNRLPVHPAGAMWRRQLLTGLGGWAALHGMEDTGALMAASAVADGVLVDVDTLRYRRHPGQRSRQKSEFAGGGVQVALIRQRAALLMSMPRWVPAPDAGDNHHIE